MSLADELLADLEILDEGGDERDEDKMEVIDEIQGEEAISDKSVKSISKLLDSKEVCIYCLYCHLLTMSCKCVLALQPLSLFLELLMYISVILYFHLC